MNDKIHIKNSQLLSDNYYILKKYSIEHIHENGKKEIHQREVYDRGNGAVILLYHPEKKSVILTKQFRIPTYVNGNKDGMLIEACAGQLDEKDPEACIIRETQEENGYHIKNAKKVFESYMSPGIMTEILYFFIAEYDKNMKKSKGGGLDEEGEEIEVVELDFDQAYSMIKTGEIKDSKTIMLLQYAKINGLC